jgi:hypothetical protein
MQVKRLKKKSVIQLSRGHYVELRSQTLMLFKVHGSVEGCFEKSQCGASESREGDELGYKLTYVEMACRVLGESALRTGVG